MTFHIPRGRDEYESFLSYHASRLFSSCSSHPKTLQEGRQRKGVAAVLDTENAEKETVEDEHDAGIEDDHSLLDLDTAKAWCLVREANGTEGKSSICEGGR